MKVLVANRAEIACRILRTLREMRIPSVAVFTDVDVEAPHVFLADEAVPLGSSDGYLSIERVVGAARDTGATAIHPGYGFLAENPQLARACVDAGLTFIGPTAETMAAFADKRSARTLAQKHGVPVVPGAQACDSVEQAEAQAKEIGYPVLIKAAAGGGGKGMRSVKDATTLSDAFESAQREATAAFGDGRLLMEKHLMPVRHVEVQILGDGKDVMALGERECSLQRRYQKLVEESPSPGIDDATRNQLVDSALTLARAANYLGAGTVEFLVTDDGEHYFLEVNGRLQVEHPVTEMRCGIDIVRAQIELAHGGSLPADVSMRGHAIEVRLVAENPGKGFMPSTGLVRMLEWPTRPHVRLDVGIEPGSTVSAHYDSLLGKIIAWGDSREVARLRLVEALRDTTLLGVATNLTFMADLLESDAFVSGQTFTTTLESWDWKPPEIPDWVRDAAGQSSGHSAMARRDGCGPTYTPWTSLAGFRIGQ